MLGLTASSLNIEYLMADILEESRNPATEAYRAAYIANSSNSTPNSNSNPSKKGKNKKKGKKKASYNIEGQNYSAKSAKQASFMLGSYNLAIEEEEESDSSSNSSSSSDSNTQLAQLLALKGYKKRKDFKGKGLKTSSKNKAKYKDNQPRRRPRDPALYNSWLYNTGSTDHISNSKERFTTFTPNTGQLRPINTGNGPVSPAGIGSITLEVLSRKAPPTYTKLVLDNVLYLPNININIVSRVRHYNSGGCLIKETLYGGDRRCIAVLDFKKSGFFLDVKGSSKPILHANFAFPLGLTSYNTTKSIEPQRNKIVVEIPSNSIRKEDYRPIIEDAIVSEAIEPNKRYKLRNSPAKGTTLEGVGPSLRGKRPRRPVEPLATAQAPYQSPCKTREPKPLTGTRDLPRVLREPVIKGNKEEKAISSPTLKEPNIGQRDYYNLLNIAKLWHVRLGHIGLRLLKKTSSITKGLPNFDKIKEADFHCSSCDRGKAVRRVSPIVANAIKGFLRGLRNGFGRYPTKFHFDGGTEITDLLTTWLAKRGIKFSTSAPYIYEQNGLVERSVRVILDLNSIAITNKETTPFQTLFDELEPGIPHIPNLERYRAIGAGGEAIIPLEKRSKSLKFTSRTEECKLLVVLGSKTYLVYIPSRRAVLKTSTVKFIEDNTVLSQPTNNTALEGELVDLDLYLEGAVSPDPSNLNTEKPISIEIGPSKLEPYESSSDSELDEPLPDKPINPVIVGSTRPTISIRKPELPEAFPQTIKPIFAPKPIEVIAPNQPITNEPLDNSDLISEGDKIQLDSYKLLAKTSSYILSFVYKARKRVISKDSTPTTYKQVLKLPRDERRVFKFLPRSLLPSNRKLITCRNVLKVKKDAKNRPMKYKSRLVARGFMQVEGLDYTVTYASTSIPPTWRILLAIGAVLDWEIEQAVDCGKGGQVLIPVTAQHMSLSLWGMGRKITTIITDQAKGKGIAPKRASNPADPGQSSRPLPPIRTLSEDEEDGEDYSEVIEVLKQYIKSYKRVIASQSSDIKTLLLSLNTLKASVEDSVSAIKNISSTLASLTNSSNAAATGKTSYSPRFDPFSGTMDLDSPPYPPRKEPHLGPAVDNTATSNLDPPIDTGSKEGFKDTITSSIVKELSKKAYTIPDDRISNFLENPDISNTYSNSDQAVLLMLLRDSLSSSPRAAISWIYIPSKAFKLLVRQYSRPIESKKEDVYNEFHALTFSTYRKGLSAFNAEFNGYLAKLTIAKIDIDPSLILNLLESVVGGDNSNDNGDDPDAADIAALTI
ncbi:hypothetical protein P8C59_003529 [Phyllachora maydis]|uniref:Integrase catalytic domain-containing protein n=1 Tax=Phyllachora maydis TaxID=1825666 RepID=A0AAD9I1R2_9PEZI|nr:hypothetical protein P8C59_003529 [Phyllachora maydis]